MGAGEFPRRIYGGGSLNPAGRSDVLAVSNFRKYYITEIKITIPKLSGNKRKTIFYKMGRFEFRERAGRCWVTDTKNGVSVDWLRGDFNGTQDAEIIPFGRIDTLREQGTTAAELAGELAKCCREMGDYVRAEHPETI